MIDINEKFSFAFPSSPLGRVIHIYCKGKNRTFCNSYHVSTLNSPLVITERNIHYLCKTCLKLLKKRHDIVISSLVKAEVLEDEV
jgi:hypothetical protein